jgi:hypothetical protein
MVRAGIAAGVAGDGLAGVVWNPPPGVGLRGCSGLVPPVFRGLYAVLRRTKSGAQERNGMERKGLE